MAIALTIPPKAVANIGAHPLFATLPADGLDRLLSSAEGHRYALGDFLIQRDEFNPYLFLITAGGVEVRFESGEKVGLGIGAVVGEISVSGMSFPVADVVAAGDASAIRFPIETVTDLVVAYPDFGEALRAIGTSRTNIF